MTLPNDAHTVTAGSGQTLATHRPGSKHYPAVMLADANGILLNDPSGCFSIARVIVPSNQPTHLCSLFNADASLIVDVLAAFATPDTQESSGVPTRCRLNRITAHSNGALADPVKVDTQTADLDADITFRYFTSSLSCTLSGSPLTAQMTYPFQPGAGQYGHFGKNYLWNYLKEGSPIVLRQNEGLAITTPTDSNSISEPYVGFVFRVR